MLTRTFSEGEIHGVVKQMKTWSFDIGPRSLQEGFYKSHWNNIS